MTPSQISFHDFLFNSSCPYPLSPEPSTSKTMYAELPIPSPYFYALYDRTILVVLSSVSTSSTNSNSKRFINSADCTLSFNTTHPSQYCILETFKPHVIHLYSPRLTTLYQSECRPFRFFPLTWGRPFSWSNWCKLIEFASCTSNSCFGRILFTTTRPQRGGLQGPTKEETQVYLCRI